LSRSQILDAALKIVGTEGVNGLTMRKLAGHLGVEAMSLYNHVKDKRDLLEGVVNVVLSRIVQPDPKLPWAERLEVIFLGLYNALVAYPQLVLLLASERAGLKEPGVLSGMDRIIAALAESGLSPAQQVSAFRGMVAMCCGFVLTHTLGFSATKSDAETHWAQWDATKWDGAGVPHLARLAPQFLKTRPDDDLRFMLQAYLGALQVEAGKTHADHRGRPSPNRQ
jgi:TetR/AcrR family tetracycline transcriptional repressor